MSARYCRRFARHDAVHFFEKMQKKCLPAKPVLDLDGAGPPDIPPDRPTDRLLARGGALAAHFSPAGWASPVSSTSTPWAQGPWAQGPTALGPTWATGLRAQDFRENFTFLGCRFLYPELLPDPVGVFSTYSRPDISHFGPKSAGFRGRGMGCTAENSL